MPFFMASFLPVSKSAPKPSHLPGDGLTSCQREFLQQLRKEPARAPVKRSFLERVDGAAHKALKALGHQVGVHDPRSFAALKRAYTTWSVHSQAGLDEVDARRVRQMASTYLAGKSQRGNIDDVGRAKIRLAACYVAKLDRHILAHRRDRQRRIDAQFQDRHGDQPASRHLAREHHAQALRDLRRDIDRADAADGQSPPPAGDGSVRGVDDAEVYEFHPMPTRAEVGETGQGPQNAALVSALNAQLKQYLGVDFGLPDASPATLDEAVGVLIDSPPPTRKADIADLDGQVLRRGMLAQWLIGAPRAGWEETTYDAKRGVIRPTRLPGTMLSPVQMAASVATGGAFPLLEDPGHPGAPLVELHRPIDRPLVDALLRLDLQRLKNDLLKIGRDAFDVAVALRAVRAGLGPRHFAFIRREAVDRLLAPLTALQTALKTGADLPIAMVLADAEDELSRYRGP